VNDGIVVEIIYGGHEAILELLLGGDANVPQDGAGEFREEALDEIEPSQEQMDGQLTPPKGIDRSGELTPSGEPVPTLPKNALSQGSL